MKILALICRILLGLMFVVIGLNGFFNFIPQGAMPPAGSPAGEWMGVMMKTGWMHHIFFFEILGGVLVLIGGTAPLGLCILAGILANIFMFHVTLMGGHGLLPGTIAAVLEIVLIYAYRASFVGIFTTKAKVVS
jgi:uncharacterized membrane protein YphA (DoxX/SURF4 family)